MTFSLPGRPPTAGLALAFGGGLLAAGAMHLPLTTEAQTPAPSQTAAAKPVPPSVQGLQSLSESFASVAEQVKPSVVYIKSGKKGGQGDDDDDTPQHPQLPPGFERFFPQLPQMQPPQFQEAAGSGFIVSRDGYILTNDHVVDNSDQVTVRLLDRREFEAKVVGTDPGTDLAVLKIDADNLTPAPLGNSEDSRVGEWVLAVGNPLGENLTFTVTSGIISAKGRSLALPNANDRSIQDFIQTDAAINPGNSGGPLVSVGGDVIGVNSAIASETGFYSGYGFAIPIDLAHRVMDQLISGGRVHRVALGITVQEATPNDAAYVGLPDIRGVIVQDFTEKSPAQRAGMEAGDIIISVDGKPVEYVGQLQQQIAFRKPGESVKVEVARKGGVRKTFGVQLQEVAAPKDVASRNSDDSSDSRDRNGEAAASVDLLGLTVQPLDQDAVQQFDLQPGQQGLLVTG